MTCASHLVSTHKLHRCVQNKVKISATSRSEAGLGFRGGGGERRNHCQREFKVRMSDGRTEKSTWWVPEVKTPHVSVAEMIAHATCVLLDRSDPRVVMPRGDVIPLRKAGTCSSLMYGSKDRRDWEQAGLPPAGLCGCSS